MQVGDLTITPLSDKRVELSIGTKKTEVDFKDLWGVVFLLSNKDQKDSIVPVQKTERMVFSRKHVVQLKKDMKAGETMNVWCEVSIPQTIVEAIALENGAKVIIRAPEEVKIE